MNFRSALVSALVLASFVGPRANARDIPNFDANAEVRGAVGSRTALQRHGAASQALRNLGATATQFEPRLGVPTFVWGARGGGVSKARTSRSSARSGAVVSPELRAREHLGQFAAAYGVAAASAENNLALRSLQDRGDGMVIAKFRQQVQGVEVFRQEVNVLMDANLELVAISGYMSPHLAAAESSPLQFKENPNAAVARALKDLTGTSVDGASLQLSQTDEVGYSHFTLAGSAVRMGTPARLKPVLFELPAGLEPAYYVEVDVANGGVESDYYSYVLSAVDGRLLFRNNLTAHADFTYRVYADASGRFTPWDGPLGTAGFPHPTGVPDGSEIPLVSPQRVTLSSGPISTRDPWLSPTATITRGNNVEAYADLASPDGLSAGDFHAGITGPNTFDYAYDFSVAPNADQTQVKSAITYLFYMNNWLHDWFYDAGFDEASGNAQANNYGRGGIGGDSIKAEAQDVGGRNNANMQTPADGARPRMQMYLFDAAAGVSLTAISPTTIGVFEPLPSSLGDTDGFDVTGDVILVDDGVAAAATPTTAAGTLNDGCEPIPAASQANYQGKLALVDRGLCAFAVKVENLQKAGAAGVIVANTVEDRIAPGGTNPAGVTIPVVGILKSEGARIRTALEAGTVRMQMRGLVPGQDRDGTIDGAVVAHEWGHYISNRLIGNANGLNNNQGGSMGEGWGDFTALLTLVRAEDAAHPANPNWDGAFGAGVYVNDGPATNGAYYAIRRVPYSADFTKNALTFKHIQEGVPLPFQSHPVKSGLSGADNSEVHNSGEVWASMLWECYVSLLRDTGRLTFDEAQARMKAYLVAAYKMTPSSPTFLEARDAVLAAAAARDELDYQLFLRAFARRGAGMGAVGPDRYSYNHVGVVESFSFGPAVSYVSTYLDDSTSSCEVDGVLDNGETGRLAITAKNNGAVALSGTTARVTTTNPHVTFPDGDTVQLPASAPGQLVTASIRVAFDGATSSEPVEFDITVDDPALDAGAEAHGTFQAVANADYAYGTSTRDTVSAPTTPWLISSDTSLGASPAWQRVNDASGGHWFLPNNDGASDHSLVSPALVVGAGDFTISYRYRHDFDWWQQKYTSLPFDVFWEGGVLEVSTDGANWQELTADATQRAAAGYNGTMYVGGETALAGRPGWVGRSAGYPAYRQATINLGTRFAGQTVYVRFRGTSDSAAGYNGFDLDDIEFGGITNTPFASALAETSLCSAPPAAVIAGPTAADERTQVTLDASGSVDPEGGALTYRWMQRSGPPVLLTNTTSAQLTFDAPEVKVNTPVTFWLVVRDASGNDSAPVAKSVTIRQVNRAPTVSVVASTTTADEGTTITLTPTFADADAGDTLSLTWSQTVGPTAGIAVDATTKVATITLPDVNADTDLTFQVTVGDGAATTPATTTVRVLRVNRLPVLTVPASVAADERTVVQVAASAVDADGDAITYAWTQTGTPTAELVGAATNTISFVAPSVPRGTTDLHFTVKATDTFGGEATADVVVTVSNVNRRPVAHVLPAITVDERTDVVLDGLTSTDEDAEELTYSWAQVITAGQPEVTITGPQLGLAHFVAPEVTADTTLTFTLTVIDGSGAESTEATQVTVRNVNRVPVAKVSSATLEATSGESVTLDATGTVDADGDALTYGWTQLAGAQVTIHGGASSKATFTAPAVSEPTTLTFEVVAHDGTLTSAPARIGVNIQPAEAPKSGCSTTGGSTPLVSMALLMLGLVAQRRRQARG